MVDNLGSGVTRVLDPTQTSYTSVIWQGRRPPLDSELNFIQALENDWRKQLVARGTPSGWLGSETNSGQDYIANPSWSNWFQFGRQRSGETRAIQWAVVNGWLVPVTGTRTGAPPGSPDDVDTWNKIALDPPPSNSGDFRSDFVFLEVWLARVPPNPSSTNKPSSSGIYRYGNVEGGYSFLADDIQDPGIGFETTERVQLQYRVRVAKGLVGLATYPDGFDPALVKGWGTDTVDSSFTFTNMRQALGDPGLWRAGDGTENTLGTVDGYTYAIPMAAVFRRNSVAWNGEPSPNLNGSLNRNPTAVDRTGIKTFSTIPTTSSTILATATVPFTVSLASASNIPLPTAPATPVLVRIGDEYMLYSGISGTTMTISARAQNGTIAEYHATGQTISVQSMRPDGLFADQVAKTDILDLRHTVNFNGFDYSALLKKNLDKLLRGQLQANWKRSGSTQGVFLPYQDLISSSGAVGSGITKLDSPDNIRTIFSDAAVQQKILLVVRPSVSAHPSGNVNVNVSWAKSLTVQCSVQASGNVFSAGDVLTVPITQFKSTLPGSDADQNRFLHEVLATSGGSTTGTCVSTSVLTDTTQDFIASGIQFGDSVVVTSGSAVGTYVVQSVTSSTTLTVSPGFSVSTSFAYEIRQSTGSVKIRPDGTGPTYLPLHYYTVTRSGDSVSGSPNPTDNLVITFSSAYPGSETVNHYIEVQLQYGPGRGLSRRPDAVHSITVLSGSTDLLLAGIGVPPSNVKVPTSWFPLWNQMQDNVSQGLLPVAAPSFVDPGSKTVAMTPFRRLDLPANQLTQDGSSLNGGQGLMPLLKSDNTTSKWTTTDPLGLFSATTQGNANQKNIYVSLPRSLVPGFGAFHVPILAADTSTFSQGINFLWMSKSGSSVDNPSQSKQFINYANGSLSYAAFSTRDISVSPSIVPSTYNGTFTFGGNAFAGMRQYTDSRNLGRQGLEMPPFYGIARLFAVYEAEDYRVNGSAFSPTTRAPTGAGAKNLLRQNFEGPTFWVELDSDLDSTFILNAAAIDITKSTVTSISSFASGNYVIEASIFGFDRGSFALSGEFRAVMSRNRDGANSSTTRSLNLGQDLASFSGAGQLNSILPGPLPAGGTQVLINYSRTPYQGDAWGSQTGYTDLPYVPGSVASASAYQVVSAKLTGPYSRPNQKSLEVLASTSFMTTMGTGRFAGNTYRNYMTSFFDPRNIGWEGSGYPPGSPSQARPLTLPGGLGLEEGLANSEYLGCTERLPLGALFRDKDFRGGLMWPVNTPGVGQGRVIKMDFDQVGNITASLTKTNNHADSEVNIMGANLASGVPGEILVHVDGEPSNYTLLTNYRVYRGGSVFNGTDPYPGGEFVSELPALSGPHGHTNVLSGKAMLVRNTVTSVGASEVSAGDELMMLIVTTVQFKTSSTNTENVVFIGSNGVAEGYAAADIYRIEGRPLLVDSDRYDIDPTTITLSNRFTDGN